ncbi:MAG: amidase, partial [Bacteroidota bacterium]
TPPAIWFNPTPVGFQYPQGKSTTHYPIPAISLPVDTSEWAFLSVLEWSYLIKSQQISSKRLTRYFLDRLKSHDPELHCVISLTEERALSTAQKADQEIKAGQYRGPLHGIPYGAKDLFAAKGYKTTWGATPYQNQVLGYDATIIQKLEAAGAVLCAKLSLGALAMGDVWYGETTRNPWDTEKGSSGSSAGSASAVSAGLIPFAIGTETYGSIISPSTVCGTTGLRPTFGRVSRYGAMALSWTMDKIGPITRTVDDAALVFEAIQGKDEKDQHTLDLPFRYNGQANPKTLKVGYLKSDFEADYPFKQQDALVLETLRSLGFELIPIELPDYPIREMTLCIEVESAAAFSELTLENRDDELVRQGKNAWPNFFRLGRLIPAVEYVQVNRLRYQLIQDMDKLFQQVDVYIAPSWASTSLPLTNLSGHPAIVLPNGFQEGTPTSITFTGKLYEEGQLLSLAKAYQDATDFHTKHPEKFKK